MYIKTFELFESKQITQKITKEEILLVKASNHIKTLNYIIEDIEGPLKKFYGDKNAGLIHISHFLEHNHGYIPSKYHPSGVRIETSGKEDLKFVIKYQENTKLYFDNQSKSSEEFFGSDHYLEFIDRIKGYCDDNGYVIYIDNSEKSWKSIYIGVKKSNQI